LAPPDLFQSQVAGTTLALVLAEQHDGTRCRSPTDGVYHTAHGPAGGFACEQQRL